MFRIRKWFHRSKKKLIFNFLNKKGENHLRSNNKYSTALIFRTLKKIIISWHYPFNTEKNKYAAFIQSYAIKLLLYTLRMEEKVHWRKKIERRQLASVLPAVWDFPPSEMVKKGGKFVQAWKNGFRYNDVMISPSPPTVPSCKMYYECNLEWRMQHFIPTFRS